MKELHYRKWLSMHTIWVVLIQLVIFLFLIEAGCRSVECNHMVVDCLALVLDPGTLFCGWIATVKPTTIPEGRKVASLYRNDGEFFGFLVGLKRS